MPLDITNPKIINFLIENYEKEKLSRLVWINKHRSKLQQAATLSRTPKDYFESDVLAYNMKGGMATLTRDHTASQRHRRSTPIRDATFIPGVKDQRRGHSLVDVGLGNPKEDPRLVKADDDLTLDPVMRPVDPKISKLIRKSGKDEYWNERIKSLPEKRYYFAECVNWDYGWRLKDSKASCRAVYGRRQMLMKALKNRVGPQPDPTYYKSADIPGPAKCKHS